MHPWGPNGAIRDKTFLGTISVWERSQSCYTDIVHHDCVDACRGYGEEKKSTDMRSRSLAIRVTVQGRWLASSEHRHLASLMRPNKSSRLNFT